MVTADFITPIVDDARTWGAIAAVNAISDVYAMGGQPLVALNLVGWNRDELPTELLGDVLAGAAEVAAANGFVIAGGHSIDDPEPKFGLAVVGEVHPERMLTNAGLRPGDRLILTKPLGVGVISTAIKQGTASPDVTAAAVASMLRPNRRAAEVALSCGAAGATDVTGFGLLGHLGRMAMESGVDVEIAVSAVPVLPGAPELARSGVVPGGSRRNLEWARARLTADGVEEVACLLLADAQTSGGLIFGVRPDQATTAVEELRRSGHEAADIGSAAAGSGLLVLRP